MGIVFLFALYKKGLWISEGEPFIASYGLCYCYFSTLKTDVDHAHCIFNVFQGGLESAIVSSFSKFSRILTLSLLLCLVLQPMKVAFHEQIYWRPRMFRLLLVNLLKECRFL